MTVLTVEQVRAMHERYEQARDAYAGDHPSERAVRGWGSVHVSMMHCGPDLIETTLSLYAELATLRTALGEARARAVAAEEQAKQWKARMNHACFRLDSWSRAAFMGGKPEESGFFAKAADVVSEEYNAALAQPRAGAEGEGERE